MYESVYGSMYVASMCASLVVMRMSCCMRISGCQGLVLRVCVVCMHVFECVCWMCICFSISVLYVCMCKMYVFYVLYVLCVRCWVN